MHLKEQCASLFVSLEQSVSAEMEFSKKASPASPTHCGEKAGVCEYGVDPVAYRVTGRHGASEEERSVVHLSRPGHKRA